MIKKIFLTLAGLAAVVPVLAAQTGVSGSAGVLKKDIRAEFKAEIKTDMASRTAAIATIKADLKAKIEKERVDFKKKLAAIKDAKKKTILTHLDSEIAKLNKNVTTRFSGTLTRLTDILVKISTKAQAGSTILAGTQADIDAATAAIASAKTANDAQALKIYTIAITTEANLGVDAGKTRQQLRADVDAVQALVLSARQAVRKAANDVEPQTNTGADTNVETK